MPRLLSISILAAFLLMPMSAQAEEALPLASPYGTAVRSAFVPGWGQMRIGKPIQGTFSAALLAGTLVGAWIARTQYLDVYDNEYAPLALIDPESSASLEAFDRANQRFKVSQFFVFTAVGVWAYGVIDSYVGAHIYNAELKADRMGEQSQGLESFGVNLARDAVNACMTFRF